MNQTWKHNGCDCEVYGIVGNYQVSVVLDREDFCARIGIPKGGLVTTDGGRRFTFSNWRNAIKMANGYADMLAILNNYEFH